MEQLEKHPGLSSESVKGIKYIYEFDRYVFVLVETVIKWNGNNNFLPIDLCNALYGATRLKVPTIVMPLL